MPGRYGRVTVEQVGAACHTGTHSCFSDELPVRTDLEQEAGA